MFDRILGCTLFLALVACGPEKPEPEIASSAPHQNYAATYPERLDGTMTSFSEGQVKVKELSGNFSKYPDDYADKDKIDYEVTAKMMERADEAGHSQAFVDGLREVQAVGDFYEDEKEELRRKVAGACQYAAKQAGCEKMEGGAAAAALDKTMKERLEKRLHEANASHTLLDRYREQFGEKNAKTLEKQIDEVSEASYIANIELVEHKVRLRAMVEEGERVKKTADEAIEEEKAFAAESGRTDKEKEAAQERIQALHKAKAGVDSTISKANRILEEIETRIEETQKQYKEALDKLVETMRKRAKK